MCAAPDLRVDRLLNEYSSTSSSAVLRPPIPPRSVELTTTEDSLILTAAASNGFAVSVTEVKTPNASVITDTGNSTGTTLALIHIVNAVLVPTTDKINLSGFDGEDAGNGESAN